MGYNIEEWPSASAIMTFDDGDPLENPWAKYRARRLDSGAITGRKTNY